MLRKILMAEDLPNAKESMFLELRELADDLEIHTAPDGLEAFMMAQNVKYDLILSDFEMPFFNGIDLLAAIRTKDGPNVGTSFVFISGLTEEFDILAQTYDDVHIMAKPFDSKKILDYLD